MDEEAIQHLICQYLSERFGVARELLTGASRFQEDLGLDSLEMTEVLLSVEDEIGIDLGLSQLVTVDEVTSIGALTAAAGRAAAARSETRGTMAQQSIIPAGAGRILCARGSRMAFKAVADHTSGDFSLMERTLPPNGRRPLPHRHTNCSEAFFVLDGTVTFLIAGTELRGGPEDFLLVPRGAAHTFGNSSEKPARLLVLHAPAMDAYFAELDEMWSRENPPAPEEERALMSRHGMEPA